MVKHSESKGRVVVAMSGGVDSSMAASLLQEQGYEVIGVSMKLLPSDMAEEKGISCCSLADISDARRVAHRLAIPFYVKNFQKEFEALVTQRFITEYVRGRTPNPCILCNQELKFRLLLNWAEDLGANLIATGHYASIVKNGLRGNYCLKRGKDINKDQSYFLFSLSQKELRRILFPLGAYTKSEIREMARVRGLLVADKPESQEICFVPGKDYRLFLQQRLGPSVFKPGPILTSQGEFLGWHKGLAFYTIGQRKGLGLSGSQAWYVVSLDAERNIVIVGRDSELYRTSFVVEDISWCSIPNPGPELVAEVQIRYRNRPQLATVQLLSPDKARVTLHFPQRAITPGQAAVFYQDDIVVGGGWIAS
jgi:tRNA-specific 2-thiouridylase